MAASTPVLTFHNRSLFGQRPARHGHDPAGLRQLLYLPHTVPLPKKAGQGATVRSRPHRRGTRGANAAGALDS